VLWELSALVEAVEKFRSLALVVVVENVQSLALVVAAGPVVAADLVVAVGLVVATEIVRSLHPCPANCLTAVQRSCHHCLREDCSLAPPAGVDVNL